LAPAGWGRSTRPATLAWIAWFALKVIQQSVASSAEMRERFEREARAISSLDHPHICILYDVCREADVSFLVMQYLEGETLADRLARAGKPRSDPEPPGRR
jgi:serine/threonine protein kinase